MNPVIQFPNIHVDHQAVSTPAPVVEDTPKVFEVGREYSCRSICDYDCIWTFRVTRRTEKNVWVVDTTHGSEGKEVRRKIDVWREEENFSPFGKYSMSPTVRAGKVIEPEPVPARKEFNPDGHADHWEAAAADFGF